MLCSDTISQPGPNSFLLSHRLSTDESRLLSDHIIYGEHRVPAVMMLELMAEFGKIVARAEGVLTLNNFQIVRPLKIADSRVVRIHAHRNPGGISISINADHEKNGQVVRKDILYAKAVMVIDSSSARADRSMFNGSFSHCFSVRTEDIYSPDFLESGPVFQGLARELCFGHDLFKGTIDNRHQWCDFLTNPLLVDNCFQLGNIANRIFHGYEALPVGIDSISFFNTLPVRQAYCYGRVTGYEEKLSVQEFVVCDDSDRILLSATGVRQYWVERIKFNIIDHLNRSHARANQSAE